MHVHTNAWLKRFEKGVCNAHVVTPLLAFSLSDVSHHLLRYLPTTSLTPRVSLESSLRSGPVIRLLDKALRWWHLLGSTFGYPCAAVFVELGWPDTQLICSRELLSLHGRMRSMPFGDRCPQSVGLFQVAATTQGSWVSHCVDLRGTLIDSHPRQSGSEAFYVRYVTDRQGR